MFRMLLIRALVCAPGLLGCSEGAGAASFESLCESAGLCDEAPAPPELFDVLCHAGDGTCTRESARATVESAARFAGTRPRARIRLWALGATAGDTRVVNELAAPTLTRRTRARRVQLERYVAHAVAVSSLSLEPLFARPQGRRAPIAESLAKVGLADSYGLPRRIIVISNAREYSPLRDLECGRLPTEVEFARALRRRGILGPGSLAHVEVTFAFVTSTTVGTARCPVNMGREARIRDLWRGALTAAGASEVRFDSGVPVLVGERPTRAPTSSNNPIDQSGRNSR